MMHKIALFVLMLAATSAAAQQIDLKSLDNLAEKAKETVEINMDEAMLKAGAGALSGKGTDEAAAKKAVEGLKGIYGRVFEFENDGAYSRQALDAIRKQLKAPEWSIITRVREEDEEVEMWVHRNASGVMDGMVFIVAESNELVVFNLVGIASFEDLSKIGGQFGMPQFPGTK